MRPPHVGWLLLVVSFAVGAWGSVVLLKIMEGELRMCMDSQLVTDGSGRVFNARGVPVGDTIRLTPVDSVRKPSR